MLEWVGAWHPPTPTATTFIAAAATQHLEGGTQHAQHAMSATASPACCGCWLLPTHLLTQPGIGLYLKEVTLVIDDSCALLCVSVILNQPVLESHCLGLSISCCCSSVRLTAATAAALLLFLLLLLGLLDALLLCHGHRCPAVGALEARVCGQYAHTCGHEVGL